MGICLWNHDTNTRIVKFHAFSIMFLERWRAFDELGEFWSVEREFIEEGDMRVGELRRIDSGHEVFQVFAGPFEQEGSQTGEDRACPGPTTPVPIWTR